MPLPDKDPFPLATDWQAVARLIANIYHKDSKAFEMGECFFSHSLPQTMNALIFSVMSGSSHVAFAFTTQLRKNPRKRVLPLEQSPTFRANNFTQKGASGKYKGNFNEVFNSEIVPYFSNRLEQQSGCTLHIKQPTKDIILPLIVTGSTPDEKNDGGQHLNILEVPQNPSKDFRREVLRFLVNNVVFETLIQNGFTRSASLLYRLLVRDYRVDASFLDVPFPFETVTGNKRDLLNERFGYLQVTGRSAERRSGGHVLWDCVCDCGRQVSGVPTSDLTGWRQFSCGECDKPKVINAAVIKASQLKIRQTFSNCLATATSRATKYAENQAIKGFYKSDSADVNSFLVQTKRALRDSFFLLTGSNVIAFVAGLPLYTGDKNRLDLHRYGHETMIPDSISMPYAASTICWIPNELNASKFGDSCIAPYEDNLPTIDV